MAQKKKKRPLVLPRMVLVSTIVGTLAGGCSGLSLRLYLSRLGVLNLDWSIMVFAGMVIGFLSGFERIRYERLRQAKKSLETKLGKTHQALQITREKHESLLRRIPDWIFQTDREFRLIESNRAFKDIFGYRWQKREKKSILDFIPARFHPELKRNLEEALAGKSELIELETRTPADRHLYFSLVLYPARDASQAITGVAGIMRDISERKTLERELVQAEKMAAIGTMAACVAHELRNPLGIIRTAVFNLNRGLSGKDDRIQRHITNIEQKVQETDRIITSLLEYSRLREHEKADTDINRLIEEACEQVAEQFSESEIKVVKRLGPLPLARVDRIQMVGVFENMIKNSYEAMGGSGTLTISTEFQEKDGRIAIALSDTGCGIARKNLDRLGKPFFTTKSRGIGLGLAHSYRIVEEVHKGTIEVTSEEGQGTIFRIRLPCQEKS